jgi:hypothetical protein
LIVAGGGLLLAQDGKESVVVERFRFGAWRNLEQTWRNLANKVQTAQLGEQLNDMGAAVLVGRHGQERLDGERQRRRFEYRSRQHEVTPAVKRSEGLP